MTGEIVKRFGFHSLDRDSLAMFLMEDDAKMKMSLYHSHSSRKAAQEKCSSISLPKRCGYRQRFSENSVDRELECNDELTAKWALNSAVECHLLTVASLRRLLT